MPLLRTLPVTNPATGSRLREHAAIEAKEVLDRIEAAHRAFLDWRDSEFVKEQFRRNNISTDSVISCEQKYGPRTTVRRNMALKERRRLKVAGEISSGYVKFPAILMVKDTNDTKYRQLKDFSNESVHFI